jgi:hypothetical protein
MVWLCHTYAKRSTYKQDACPGQALVFVGLGGRLRPVVVLGRRASVGLAVWVRCGCRAGLFRRVGRLRGAAFLPVGLLGCARARVALGKSCTTERQAEPDGNCGHFRCRSHGCSSI